jgi:hypothetical protein
MATCKTCGAEIIWKHTPAGNAMPLEARPVTMALMLDDGETVEMVRVWQPHWDNCPHADKFRKK